MWKQLNQVWRKFAAWTLHIIKKEIPSVANSAGRVAWPHLTCPCHTGVESLSCPGPTCHTCSPLTRMARASPTTGTTTLNLPTFQQLLSSAQIIHEKCTAKAWLFPRMWSACKHNSSYNLCWPCQGTIAALTFKGEVNSLRKKKELWGLSHTSINIMLTSAALWLFNLKHVFLWELPLSHFFALYLLHNSFRGS